MPSYLRKILDIYDVQVLFLDTVCNLEIEMLRGAGKETKSREVYLRTHLLIFQPLYGNSLHY